VADVTNRRLWALGKGEKGILQKLTKETKGHREGETTTRMIAYSDFGVQNPQWRGIWLSSASRKAR
jgi:hypothetical protein